MKKLTSNEIRQIWLKFFEDKGHLKMDSAPLIPREDKSLLWINAGVAALKKYFDGSETPPSKRMTNSQKAIRTGDIENVGITTRHHTFFEMLGNFSIGDYFKKEAITWAWELLTSEEYFGIDKSLLYITVYHEDEEALNFWKEVGVESDRIFKMGRDTNFWDLGQGPCGPSSEIFFDKGAEYDSRTAKELIEPDLENDRYIEIWNIVFSEFNNDGEGNYTKLPQQNIDTGAGLERLVSAFQGKPSNFETDLFEELIKKIDSKTSHNYLWEYVPSKLKSENNKQFIINSYYKAIADFTRSITFAIGDGATMGSTGRGYILRRLLRKAVIYKSRLGIEENFMHELVDPLVSTMGEFYPQIKERRDIVVSTIKTEEEQFNKTLLSVNLKLKELIDSNSLNEESAFRLHETFGLPMELLKDIVDEFNLNWTKIEELQEDFKNKSRGEKEIVAMEMQDDKFRGLGETLFTGYESLNGSHKVIAVNGDQVVFDQTPFFATAGGQEHDKGTANGLQVTNVIKNAEKTFIHTIENNNFNIGDEVELIVDPIRRKNLTLNHSGAHLLFRAVELVVGEDMAQQGSKVDEKFFRFDFTLEDKLSDEQIQRIEEMCKKWIDASTPSKSVFTDVETAKQMATSRMVDFEYGDKVRVIALNDEVVDLCAGTHVTNTSEIEDLKIIRFDKKGSGVFRIEAVAGNEMISKVFEEVNNELREENLVPTLNKIQVINTKLEGLGSEVRANFDDEINTLDISSSTYRYDLQRVNNSIKAKLGEFTTIIGTEINKVLVNEFNANKIYANVYSELFNIQEVTRQMLNNIDSTECDLGVAIIPNGQKVTYGFVLASKNINERNVERIKEIANKYSIRGNGKKQLYIFGGQNNFEHQEVIKEILGWEF